MKNLFLLFKIKYQSFFNSFNKKNPSSYVSILLGIILSAVIIAFSAYINYSMYLVLNSTNQINSLIPVVSSVSLLLIIMTSITKIKGTLYGSKDYNLLKTMPIKNSTIISYKILDIYLSEIKFTLFALAPTIGVLIYFDSLTAYLCLSAIFSIFLLPIFPILVFGIIGMVLSLIFDRFKYSSIITTILSIGLIAAIYIFIYMPKDDNQMANMYINMLKGFKYVDPFLNNIIDSCNENSLSLVLFIIGNLLILIVSIVLFASTYNKINMAVESRQINKKNNETFEVSSQNKALFKMEMRRIFTSHNVLINVMMGPIMTILVMVIMYLSSNFSELKETIPNDIDKLRTAFLLFGIIVLGICPYSAFSISLEGESFWILKTIPVDSKIVCKNKIIISIMTTLPFAIIASIVGGFLYGAPIGEIICVIILYGLFCIFSAYLGLYLNLKKANIHYKTEIEAIKKGSSSVKCMLISTLMAIIFISINLVFAIFLNVIYGYLISFLIIIIVIVLIKMDLDKKRDIYFKKIY